MHSPNCLYTKVALTTSVLSSLNWRRVSFTVATLKDYYGRGMKKRWESGSLPPEKFFKTTSSRTSENTLIEHRVKVAIIVKLCAQRKN